MHKLWILLIYLTASIGRGSESDWLLLTLTDDENDLAESACIFIYTKAQAPGSKNKLELSCSFF